MIIIKGNLTIKGDKLRTGSILRQAQNRIYSETSSEQINDIIALADLTKFDTTNATIIEGDCELTEPIKDTVLVTGEVIYAE